MALSRYEVRNADGRALAGLTSEGTAKAVYDRAAGIVTVGETDSLDRFKGTGWRATTGIDPLYTGALTFVTMDRAGKVLASVPVPEQGTPRESVTLMPPKMAKSS